MPDVVTLESVNTLDHRPEQDSSDKDLEERRQFLKKELNTEKMEVEEQIKEQIVDIFLKHWDLSTAKILVNQIC